jgi:hypothetical protein
MAIHRIPILGWQTVPDTSGEVFLEPYPIKATNDQWGMLVVIFNDSGTRIGIYGVFQVPTNYNPATAPNIVFVWTSTATVGDVEWDFDYRSVGGDDTTSLDQAGTDESVNANDTAPTAAHRRLEISIPLTASNFAALDTVEFEALRDGTDGGDTMAAAAILVGLLFEYSD